MPHELLFSLVYRICRYHTARAGERTEQVGFSGLNCASCDRELKEERGCRLPGYHFRAEHPWRIDFHEPRIPQDVVWFCPISALSGRGELRQIIEDALDIKEEGGLANASKVALDDLNNWYVVAYKFVLEASKRAQHQAQALSMELAKLEARKGSG